MILLEDTRQKPGKHDRKHEWFKQNGIEIRRSKLYVGDYQVPSSGERCVDTKGNVLELISDLHQQHKRFRDECIRAQEAGIKLLVLVEESLPDGKLEYWKSPVWKWGKRCGLPVTMTDPAALRKSLITMQEKYGVLFRFCSPEESGYKIIKFLNER